MTLAYFLKITAYRFFHTWLGKKILRLLSKSISVKNLSKSGMPNHPFIVAITIDTESGYVAENGYRVWQYKEPQAYAGYYSGIRNWREVINRHGAKATFFLSTNCFSSLGSERKKIMGQLNMLLEEKHEIGLHMHPDSDLAIQKDLNRKFGTTSAKFYNEDEIGSLIESGKNLIR